MEHVLGTQAQPGGRAHAGHSLQLSAENGQSRRHFKPKSSREKTLGFVTSFPDGWGRYTHRLLGNGGRRQKGHRRAVPKVGWQGRQTLWALAPGLSAEATAALPEGLPLSNKSLDALLKTSLTGDPCFPLASEIHQQRSGELPCKALP